MLERTDAITNEVLEPITFVLAYPTVYVYKVKLSHNTPMEAQEGEEA
jgi:hypothetical protein